MRSQLLRGYGYVLLSIFVWSGWVVVTRWAATGPLAASDVTALRFTVSGLILLPVALKKGFSIGPWGRWGGVTLACIMGAPYTFLAALGMKYAPASHAGTVINGTLLVTTTVLGIYLLKEPTNKWRIAGVFCSLAGIACMLSAKTDQGGEHAMFGHILLVISGLLWSFYVILVRHWKADAVQAAAAVCVLSLFLYMPPYLLLADSHITMQNWREVLFQGVYQGVITAVIALISFNVGISIIGASRAGSFIPLVPVLSTLLAIPTLGEHPGIKEIIGVSTVSFGVLLASGLFHRRPRVSDEVVPPA